jgi:hypothetical protein
MPTIEVTTPTSSACDSSTIPCSMCNSRNALMSWRRDAARRSGSPPTRRSASRSFSPPGSVRSSIPASSALTMPRLPTQDRPYSLGSSARKSMTSIACSSRTPASHSDRTTSRPVARPAIPSNRPPDGTVSLCDPTAITPSDGSAPSSRPIRLPAVSMRTARPASANRLASQARPWRNRGLKERRV